MTSVRPMTADEARELQGSVNALERFILGDLANELGGQLVFWDRLVKSGAAAQLPADLVRENQRVNGYARIVAELVHGLRSGALELAAWEPKPGTLRIGIVHAGTLRGLPLVLFVLVGTAVAGATWKIADAWLEVQRLQEQASLVRARTAEAITNRVAEVAKRDPVAAANLADSLAKAQTAAHNAGGGWLQQALSSAAGVVRDAAQSAVSPWLILGGLYLWSRRGRA